MVPLIFLADEVMDCHDLPWIDRYFPNGFYPPEMGSVHLQEICYREEAPQHAYNSWGASEPEHCDVKKNSVFPSSVAVFFSLGNGSDTGKSSLILLILLQIP